MPSKLGNDHRETFRPRSGKERPDYYIAPTHDFTQYTKDYEEKYWRRDTAFDWQQSVSGNLKAHLESLPAEQFARLAILALPLVAESAERHLTEIRQHGLPLDDDALKAIRECIPCGRVSIDQALEIQAPLERLGSSTAQLEDQLTILKRESLELDARRRLGLFTHGMMIKHLETDAEAREQAAQLSLLTEQVDRVQRALKQSKAHGATERERLQGRLREQLKRVEPGVLADLNVTRELARGVLLGRTTPQNSETARQVKDLILKRQLHGLRDIANHALAVEQSAIAPLTMGIIHYKRRREIQEAMTTFVSDEAKHSAVFRRFMAQKLEAKERIPDAIIKGGDRYMWLARFLPSAGIFLAVVVEAFGGAYLEYFGNEEHMPDPLFRSICKTISGRDEKRHMDLCAATYNELYRTGRLWERVRNDVALRLAMKADVDKTEDHPLIQACVALGLEAAGLYRHVTARLSHELARVGTYVSPERLLEFMKLFPGRGAL